MLRYFNNSNSNNNISYKVFQRYLSSFTSPFSHSNHKITLYQYKICPFCNRLKAFLDYNKVKYDTIEVNPTTKKEIKFSNYSKVPVVTLNDEVLVDSMKIIEHMKNTIFQNQSNVQTLWTEDTEKWILWSELKLAVLLYPNITRTFGESWKAFEYCKDVETWSLRDRLVNRYVGPLAMYLANFKIKKKYGIVDERRELTELLNEWTNAIGSKKFLHGEKITLPDLMVYGVLRGIEGLPAFHFAMNGNPTLEKWYHSVQKLV